MSRLLETDTSVENRVKKNFFIVQNIYLLFQTKVCIFLFLEIYFLKFLRIQLTRCFFCLFVCFTEAVKNI